MRNHQRETSLTIERTVLVGCGKKKREEKSYAWKLYEGRYFEKKMTVAMMLGHPAILSAKYGYVPISEKIEPYDEHIRTKEEHERHSWALSIANSVPDCNEIVILAGKNYRNPLVDILKEKGYKVYSPFDSSEIRGIGDQMAWCKETSEAIEDGVPTHQLL
jgi:hypothetical protein